jgi:hypothetical protein
MMADDVKCNTEIHVPVKYVLGIADLEMAQNWGYT